MTMRFDGRVALVTGAGKGLGRAYAEWLAARGARVVVNSRRAADGSCSAVATVAAIRAAGGTALVAEGSVEDEADAVAMVEMALKTFGRLDILVCNAGISPGGSFHKVDMDLFREVVDVNFYGTVYPIRAALPGMREANYGRVVITTSASAYCGSFGLSAYGSAKAAVIGLARTLAIENAGKNIRFNVVSPFAHTPMTEPFMPQEQKLQMAPEKVAPLVGWFASDACTASAAIVEAGAGRFRRVAFGVGRAVESGAEDLCTLWTALGDTSEITELTGAADAAVSLLSDSGPP